MTLWVTLLLAGWGAGDLLPRSVNQQAATILQFCRHLHFLASPHTASIFPRRSAGGPSVLGYRSSVKLARLLVQVTAAVFQFSCKLQSEVHLKTAGLTVTAKVTVVSGTQYKCNFGPKR